MSSAYFDQRQEFFRSYFERAKKYEDYLSASNPNHVERWKAYESQLAPDSIFLERVKEFKRKMPVLVLSGSWCGDCARQGPMLHAIETANSLIEFRFIDNKENPELQQELRINGAEKVPVVVSFSEDFYELSRFGDRHLSVYRRKLATELGAACDPGFGGQADELQEELREWADHFERLQAILRLAPLLRKRYGD